MVKYWTGICVVVVILLTSCGLPEQLPKPETVLPAGYSGKIVPKDFVEEIGFNYPPGAMWIRCIDCKEDWDGLNQHIISTMGPKGYKETSAQWLAAMEKDQSWSIEVRDVMHNVMRTYSSEGGYSHILLMDIKAMKEMGVETATSGDFLVLAAIDDIKQY